MYSPTRITRESDLTALRAELKEWEKAFAAEHHGRKAGKNDIKAHKDIRAKYKIYDRLRDVLAAKLDTKVFEASSSQSRSSNKPEREAKTRAVERRQAGKSSAVESKQTAVATPTKYQKNFLQPSHPNDLDPYDVPACATPHRSLQAIGPTPQRDGRVVGLFDGSGSSRRSLAGLFEGKSSAKKRKIDIHADFANTVSPSAAHNNVTPSRKKAKVTADILDHLDAEHTPRHGQYTPEWRHDRTPANSAKKFMLSQFFATPTSNRPGTPPLTEPGETLVDRTPLLEPLLPHSNSAQIAAPCRPDATPCFLRRTMSMSTSYTLKDRLLSATTIDDTDTRPGPKRTSGGPARTISPRANRTGPRTLRRYTSTPKPLTELLRNLRQIEEEVEEDDLEALREIEMEELGVPISANDTAEDQEEATQLDENGRMRKPYKKKGQKRTTRRVVMRPQPVFSQRKPERSRKRETRGNTPPDHQDELIKETQIVDSGLITSDVTASDELEQDEINHMQDELAMLEAAKEIDQSIDGAEPTPDFENGDDLNSDPDFDEVILNPPKRIKRPAKECILEQNNQDERMQQRNKLKKREAGKINPNAQSHQNFRSLKIRNKNSRAKSAGGSRFGRRK